MNPKDKRAAEIVTKTCSRCVGCGEESDQIYPKWLALYDEDKDVKYAPPGWKGPEWAEGAPPDRILAFPLGACTIFEATREGVRWAREAGVPVVFHFTSRPEESLPPLAQVVTCLPTHTAEDATRLACAWWVRVYGETPEETMARR